MNILLIVVAITILWFGYFSNQFRDISNRINKIQKELHIVDERINKIINKK